MASPLRVLLVTVLHPRVQLNAAEKQVPVPELQQLAVLLLMEGHDAAAGVDPDAPQVLNGCCLLHRGSLLSLRLYYKTIQEAVLFHSAGKFFKNFSLNTPVIFLMLYHVDVAG